MSEKINLKIDGDITSINEKNLYATNEQILADGVPLNIKYTYLVNSNETLANWLNNTQGNDYSYVAIQGNLSYDGEAKYLDDIGTIGIYGCEGSSITFNNEKALFQYYENPSEEHYINGLKIHQLKGTVSIKNCINVTNCIVDGISDFMFIADKKLYKCSGIEANQVATNYTNITDLKCIEGAYYFINDGILYKYSEDSISEISDGKNALNFDMNNGVFAIQKSDALYKNSNIVYEKLTDIHCADIVKVGTTYYSFTITDDGITREIETTDKQNWKDSKYYGLSKLNDNVYVTIENNQLNIYDSSLNIIGTIAVTTITDKDNISLGNYTYILANNNLYIINIADKTITESITNIAGGKLYKTDNYVYLAEETIIKKFNGTTYEDITNTNTVINYNSAKFIDDSYILSNNNIYYIDENAIDSDAKLAGYKDVLKRNNYYFAISNSNILWYGQSFNTGWTDTEKSVNTIFIGNNTLYASGDNTFYKFTNGTISQLTDITDTFIDYFDDYALFYKISDNHYYVFKYSDENYSQSSAEYNSSATYYDNIKRFGNNNLVVEISGTTYTVKDLNSSNKFSVTGLVSIADDGVIVDYNYNMYSRSDFSPTPFAAANINYIDYLQKFFYCQTVDNSNGKLVKLYKNTNSFVYIDDTKLECSDIYISNSNELRYIKDEKIYTYDSPYDPIKTENEYLSTSIFKEADISELYECESVGLNGDIVKLYGLLGTNKNSVFLPNTEIVSEGILKSSEGINIGNKLVIGNYIFDFQHLKPIQTFDGEGTYTTEYEKNSTNAYKNYNYTTFMYKNGIYYAVKENGIYYYDNNSDHGIITNSSISNLSTSFSSIYNCKNVKSCTFNANKYYKDLYKFNDNENKQTGIYPALVRDLRLSNLIE